MDEKNQKEDEKAAKEIPNSPVEANAEVEANTELEKLRQQLEAKELEAKENYDRLLRQAAELENLKKRMVREKTDAIRYANESLVKDLLQVLDNLERAVDHAKGGGNGKPLLEGVEMVLKGLLDVLGKNGVTQVLAKGELFDPERHEAIAHVETQEHEPNRVMEEHHKGYYLLDRLLRPALVSVAKSPKTKEEKGDVEKGPGDD